MDPSPAYPLPDRAHRERIAANLARVRARMAAAASRAGRDPAAITLVAVTKTRPFGDVLAALEAGQQDFGENRVEELWEKVHQAEAQGLQQAIRWHLIGTIQSRKSRLAVGPFALIHSVDRPKIARRLDRDARNQGKSLDVLIEVNVSGETTKHGFSPEALMATVPELLALDHLRYRGLMTMAPLVEDPEEARPVFRRLRELLLDLRERFPPERYPQAQWEHLSMGMTNDFEVAIEEGATLVRIGTAIFGPRS